MNQKKILSLEGLVPGRPANGEKMYASLPKNNFTLYGKDDSTKGTNQIARQRQNIKNIMDATHKEGLNNQLYKRESNLLGSRKQLKYRVSSEDIQQPQGYSSDQESSESDVSITSLQDSDFKKKNQHNFKCLERRPGRKKSLSCSNIRDFVKLENPYEDYNGYHKNGMNTLPNIVVQEPDKNDQEFDRLDNFETAEFDKVRKRSVSADNIPVAVEEFYEEDEKVCELPSIFLSPNLRHVKPGYVQKVEVRTRKLSKSAPNIPKQVQTARRPTPMFDESASKKIQFKTRFSSSLTNLEEVGTEGFDDLETRSEGGDLDSWPPTSNEIEEDQNSSLSSSLPSSMMEKLHQRRLDARSRGKRAHKYVV